MNGVIEKKERFKKKKIHNADTGNW